MRDAYPRSRMSPPRYAIAYTPPPESPLARFGASVLGYDCYQGADVPLAAVGGLAPAILRLMTVEAGRSGFQASFMSPFGLEDGAEQELIDAAERFAKGQPVVPVGPLAVATDGVRVVVRPVEEPAQLVALALLCREAFARWCDGAAHPNGKRQAFRFQMTLAGSAPGVALPSVTKALADAFVPMARDHLELDAISLLREDDRQRFRVVERWRLTGR